MPSTRRQLSLFLPEPERALVDRVRAEVDPLQHGLIPAHVTLCRESEIDDLDAAMERLETRAPAGVELELGAPVRLPDGCVLLPVRGPTTSFDALRAVALGAAAARMEPHVTLLHPRNARGRDDCLEAVRARPLPTALLLREVSLIEQVNGGIWRVLTTLTLQSARER